MSDADIQIQAKVMCKTETSTQKKMRQRREGTVENHYNERDRHWFCEGERQRKI